MIFAGIAALIPVGLIAFLALSKKTSPAIKKASIIALIVIGLAFIACIIILFIMLGSPIGVRGRYAEIPVMPAEQTAKDNLYTILIAAVMVLFFLIMTIILAIREQRQHYQKIRKK